MNNTDTSSVQTLNERLQNLATVTKTCLAEKNLDAAKSYIDIVEKEYMEGDAQVRNLIANIYVFSVSRYIEFHDMECFGLFPLSFIREYYAQVNSSGL